MDAEDVHLCLSIKRWVEFGQWPREIMSRYGCTHRSHKALAAVCRFDFGEEGESATAQ